jgi:segregation and condensation protein A
MIHRVQIETFDGPLELLLYLVQKQELDIEAIPIVRVTDQYLNYIQSLDRLNLENAAEFLLLAVVLIRLKMRSLLPRPELEDLETGSTVSWGEIAAEFERYREVASRLSRMEEERRRLFPRAGTGTRDFAGSGDVMILTEAFRSVLKKLEPKEDWLVERVQLRIEETIESLREVMREHRMLNFIDHLMSLPGLGEVIITFLAALELVRLGEVRVSQDEETGAINLFQATGFKLQAQA